MLATDVQSARSVTQRRTSGPLAAVVGLALSVVGVCLAGQPAPAVSTLQSTRLMTWPRSPGASQVTDIEDWLVAGDGTIYVATGGRVKEFGPDGVLLHVTQPALGGGMAAFAVDSKGCIYAIHGRGGVADLISKFDAQGKLLTADPTEADGLGGIGTERLHFGPTRDDGTADLVSGEIESFADQVVVECKEHGVHSEFLEIAVDPNDHICVRVNPWQNPYGVHSVAFGTDGHFLSLNPMMPVGADSAGRKYVWSEEAQAMLMYSPEDEVLRVLPKSLPVDGPTIMGPSDTQAFEVGQEIAGSGIAAVDAASNLYKFTTQRQDPPVDLGGGRVIGAGSIAYKMDNAGDLLGRSGLLPLAPDASSDHYTPRVDAQGRVYWLNFLPDRTEVMRGAFAP